MLSSGEDRLTAPSEFITYKKMHDALILLFRTLGELNESAFASENPTYEMEQFRVMVESKLQKSVPIDELVRDFQLFLHYYVKVYIRHEKARENDIFEGSDPWFSSVLGQFDYERLQPSSSVLLVDILEHGLFHDFKLLKLVVTLYPIFPDTIILFVENIAKLPNYHGRLLVEIIEEEYSRTQNVEVFDIDSIDPRHFRQTVLIPEEIRAAIPVDLQNELAQLWEKARVCEAYYEHHSQPLKEYGHPTLSEVANILLRLARGQRLTPLVLDEEVGGIVVLKKLTVKKFLIALAKNLRLSAYLDDLTDAFYSNRAMYLLSPRAFYKSQCDVDLLRFLLETMRQLHQLTDKNLWFAMRVADLPFWLDYNHDVNDTYTGYVRETFSQFLLEILQGLATEPEQLRFVIHELAHDKNGKKALGLIMLYDLLETAAFPYISIFIAKYTPIDERIIKNVVDLLRSGMLTPNETLSCLLSVGQIEPAFLNYLLENQDANMSKQRILSVILRVASLRGEAWNKFNHSFLYLRNDVACKWKLADLILSCPIYYHRSVAYLKAVIVNPTLLQEEREIPVASQAFGRALIDIIRKKLLNQSSYLTERSEQENFVLFKKFAIKVFEEADEKERTRVMQRTLRITPRVLKLDKSMYSEDPTNDSTTPELPLVSSASSSTTSTSASTSQPLHYSEQFGAFAKPTTPNNRKRSGSESSTPDSKRAKPGEDNQEPSPKSSPKKKM